MLQRYYFGALKLIKSIFFRILFHHQTYTQSYSFGCLGVFLLSFINQTKVKFLNKLKFSKISSYQILHTKTQLLLIFAIFSEAMNSFDTSFLNFITCILKLLEMRTHERHFFAFFLSNFQINNIIFTCFKIFH